MSENPAAISYTRGIGMYPGAPSENFQPDLILDPEAPYRNLALLRPAYSSSAYDYNLTAQLITDGLIDTHLPDWITTVVDGQILPKTEREIVVDHFESAVLELPSSSPTVELHLGGGTNLPEVDRVELFVVVPNRVAPNTLTFTVSVSEDGHTWHEVGRATGGEPLPTEKYPPDLVRGAHLLRPSIPFNQTFKGRYYRAHFAMAEPSAASTIAAMANAGTTEAKMAGNTMAISWRLGQMAFFRGNRRINLGGPYSFTSAWKGISMGEEWVSIDLGSSFTFDNVKLHWIARAAEGTLQVSDDDQHWRDVQPLRIDAMNNLTGLDDLKLVSPATGRYVRVLMTRPNSPDGYILSEMEVFGHGGFIIKSQPMPTASVDGRVKHRRGSLETSASRLQRHAGRRRSSLYSRLQG